jgi:hypothetical protein
MREFLLSTFITTRKAIGRYPGTCALLLSLWLAPALGADTGAAYGERVVRSTGHWSDGVPPAVAAPAPLAASAREAYERALSEARGLGGPYAAALEEPLLGLARDRWASGDLAAAREMLGHAIHVVRVNDGLNSERQIPLLRELIALDRSSGDLTALDERIAYLFFLQGSGQPPYTPQRLQATLDYLQWQREALRLQVDPEAGARQRLRRLLELNQQLLDALPAPLAEEGDPVPQATRWLLLQSQLSNLYLLQQEIALLEDAVSLSSGLRTPRWPGEQADPELEKLEQWRLGGLARGRSLLEDFASTLPAGGALRREVRLALADWLQWNGLRSPAVALYRELAQELAAQGEQEILAQWFAEPVELPDNGAFWQPPATTGQTPLAMTLTFDVSAAGRASRVSSAAVAGDDESIAARLRRELRQVRFRPRIERGEPVATAGLRRSYIWLPPAVRRSR